MDVSRRTVLAGGAVLAGAAALGLGPALPVRRAAAADRPALPIPAELRADAMGEIHIAAQAGEMQFRPGPLTPTYGFNGPFLGPAIRVRRGDAPVVRVSNRLTQDITLHWHGLIIPGPKDGGPYRLIPPGTDWMVQLPIRQPAETLWFHPHIYPSTAELVIRGLAGLFIIDDEEGDALGLPASWGVDDIPVILQDRRFQADGAFFHRFNTLAVGMGYVGDTMLVNGAIDPVVRTAKGWLRLRILDGSNARNYRLAASDGRTLHVIASDGGLLAEPVALKELPIAAGERYEILVDARDGKPFDLVSLPVAHQAIMRLPPFDAPLPLLTVRPDGAEGRGRLPDRLASLPAIPDRLPPVSQGLVMQMYRDVEAQKLMRETGFMAMVKSGRTDPAVVARVVQAIETGPALPLKAQLTANGINGRSFSLIQKGFDVPVDTDLVWAFSEETDRMLHPIHIHGCQYRVVARDGKPPPPILAGWKDTLPIENGGTAEIFVRFPYKAGADAPYMAHCHNLEHEDSGMMTEFTVS
ncbi:MAG: multicopper oxidase CueO [Sneathiellaceae bacterium]